LEVRLESPDGKLIGSMNVNGTGDWQKWSTQTCAIEETSGKHNVYLVFTGEEGYLFNINWWKPNTPDTAVIIGDLNGDGAVDIYDLSQMRKAAMEDDAERFAAADINGDDTIDGEDLTLLKRFIMGEIKSFD
ncbi:MAG: carbohydrate-binding protein, partial [Ruminococcus sp.]|nr:carbohydrate-binding protein [Ruminococcus sp.]